MPGALEQAWLQVPKGEACAFARNAVTQPDIALWLSATNHSRGEHPQSLPDEEVAQLSRISWGDGCEEVIEPLVGNGRHPLAWPWPCSLGKEIREAGRRYDQRWSRSKPYLKYATDHLLLANRCPGAALQCRPGKRSGGAAGTIMSKRPPPRNLYYDLGCAMFGQMLKPGASSKVAVGMGPSIPLFHDMFRRNCIAFDATWAWEAKRFDPAKWWKHVPEDMKPRLTFYNEPVNLTDASFLGVLESTARVEDYVVVKLDIDTPWLEKAILEQLLERPRLARLVDELFFEFHFLVDDRPACPGESTCWRHKGLAPDTVHEALSFMQRLRQHGIRAHFWV